MKRALIVVDVQNDFIDGPMKVNGAKDIIPVINSMIEHFDTLIITKDWHPYDHCSFKENGGEWPKHCIASTHGAKVHEELKVRPGAYYVNKANNSDIEQYSAFYDAEGNDTGLSNLLKKSLGVDTVYICGLTTDYCVQHTAIDAFRCGLETHVVLNACREVDEERCKQAHKRMHKLEIKTENVGFSPDTEMMSFVGVKPSTD